MTGWMDGWMDGWMGGWVDGWMGLTDKLDYFYDEFKCFILLFFNNRR